MSESRPGEGVENGGLLPPGAGSTIYADHAIVVAGAGSVGNVTQHLREGHASDVVLDALPAGLPAECWERAFRAPTDPLRARWLTSNDADASVRLTYDQLVASRPLQEELIAWAIANPRDANVDGALESLLLLSTQLETLQPRSATELFRKLENLLKDSGRFDLVLAFAHLSAHACQVVPRDDDIVEREAQARTCGISWVYQRTGRLHEAEAELDRAEALNDQVDCRRGLAFTMKCRGRLRRLLAERSDLCVVASDRGEHLARSEADLTSAREFFREVGGFQSQIGDSLSLLARTVFVRGDVERARELVNEAGVLLVEPWSKARLDLWILRCEIAWALAEEPTIRRLVLDELDVVVAGVDYGFELNEIRARALSVKARFLREIGDETWRTTFDAAVDQLERLDHRHARAELLWWLHVADGVPDPVQEILLREPPAVRVHAWEMYETRNEVASMFDMNRELQGDDLRLQLEPYVVAARAADARAAGEPR